MECKFCGLDFDPKIRFQKYCSEKCRVSAWKKKRNKIKVGVIYCERCGTEIVRKNATRFCSTKCYMINAMKERRKSYESIKKKDLAGKKSRSLISRMKTEGRK